eukprot:c26902_g1_i1 orf=445-2097(+)
MASDEEFMLYEVTQSATALAACGRPDMVRHDGRSHSDEAESSQKPYSTGDARDEYSEDQDFCDGHPGSLAGNGRLHGKSLDVILGSSKGFSEGLDSRVLGIQSHNLVSGINGIHLQRRPHRVEAETSKSLGSVGKRRDRDETSDEGTYFKKTKSNGGDGYKKDREEWSDGAISCLLDAYTEKYLQLNRGNLRGSDWEEVAAIVSERANAQKLPKTVDQCKNKVDSLKKRYKTEKKRGVANGMTVSYWPWFKKVDQIAGTGAKLSVMSDDEKDGAPGLSSSAMKPTRRFQVAAPVTLGFVHAAKKAPSPLRWRRVLLKVSGAALAGDRTQNVDPKVVLSIAREVASVTRLGVEVAIVVGGGNFFDGPSWVSTGGLDRASADNIEMMASIMNSIFLQASLESVGVPTRVQTAFRMEEVAEPYIRHKAIRHLEKHRVVIFAARTGNPYFTTDTAAALRAAEIHAEVILKATTIDGIYDCDPKLNPDAVLLEHISYRDVAAKGTTVMDLTAVTLCQENGIPVVIFNLNEAGNITQALSGERIGTLIDQTGGIYQ